MKKIIILFFIANILCFSNTKDEEESGGWLNAINNMYKFVSTSIKIYDAVEEISFEALYMSALNEDTQEKRLLKLKELEKGIETLSKKDTIKLWYQLGYNNIDLNEGIDYYTNVILLDSEYQDTYFRRGINKDSLGDSKGAILDFTKAIESDPKNLEAYFRRGINKDSLGNHEGAIWDFTKIIELNPKVLAAYNNRAEIYLKKKEFKLALKDLSNIVVKNEKFKFEIDITWKNYQMFKLFLKKERLYNFF
jgi:tetratricopeptide (TPR) repeat protein